MTIWACLVNILRCVLVATTKGSKPISLAAPVAYSSRETIKPAPSDGGLYTDDGLPMEEDRPHVRHRYRRVLGVFMFAAWLPIITGTVMGYIYAQAENDASKTQGVETMR